MSVSVMPISKKVAMKVPFGFKNVHGCEAVAMMCVDFRFRKQTVHFVREYLGFISFNLIGLVGSSGHVIQDSAVALDCLEVSCDLHGVKTIIVIHHEDCGHYGGSVRFNNQEIEQEFHEKELNKTKKIILEKFPGKNIVLVYARLVDDRDSIEFVIVD